MHLTVKEKFDDSADVIEVAVGHENDVNPPDSVPFYKLQQGLPRTSVDHHCSFSVAKYGAVTVTDVQDRQTCQVLPRKSVLEPFQNRQRRDPLLAGRRYLPTR